jgi:hypothetical protein
MGMHADDCLGNILDNDDWEDDGMYYDPERDCPRCKGSGEVPTEDYESYSGDNYKPCNMCNGWRGP